VLQIAVVILLGIVVAQLAFIILVLQAEAGHIRDFLNELHVRLGAIVQGVEAVRIQIEYGQSDDQSAH
jgi:hypothetical protein